MKLLVTRTLLFVGVLFVVVVVFVSRFSPCVLLPGDSWWHSVATRFVCFCFEFLSFLQCSLVSPRRASYTHALVSSVTHGLLGWFSQQVTSVLHSPRKCTTCRHKTRCATRSMQPKHAGLDICAAKFVITFKNKLRCWTCFVQTAAASRRSVWLDTAQLSGPGTVRRRALCYAVLYTPLLACA